jgi:hypothetical protein
MAFGFPFDVNFVARDFTSLVEIFKEETNWLNLVISTNEVFIIARYLVDMCSYLHFPFSFEFGNKPRQ